MKTLVGLLSVLVCFAVQAATWTIHAFKDNYTHVSILSPGGWPSGVFGQGSEGNLWFIGVDWDWNWDQLYPDNADSGAYVDTMQIDGSYSNTSYLGYQDTWGFDPPTVTGLFWDATTPTTQIFISGGAPDYGGGVSASFNDYPPSEVWIDFASDGTLRLSTSLPPDFGKWAWDGSLNPNYVAPLAIHGKSHKKPK